MAKLIKKSKCKFEAGQIVKGSELIGIPWNVHSQLMLLETMVQQHDYIAAQPKYQPAPTLDGFELKSALKPGRPYFDKPDTPTVDKRTEEALAYMAEVDQVNEAEYLNKWIDRFGALIDWLAADKFVEGDCTEKIDTPVLGNPLELTPDEVAAIIAHITNPDILMGV